MTKKEIIEAIENNESIWGVSHHRMYELKAEYIEKIGKEEIEYLEYNENYHLNLEIDLLNSYNTKAEAEHYLHHANVTRVEQLPFLTWKDIEIQMKKMESFGLNRNDRVLARIITKDSIYYFKLCKDFDLFTFQLKQTYIGEDLCEQIRDKFPVSLGEAIEENFYKAYDECVRLFKQE